MKRNNLFCNGRIKMKDGRILKEKSPHVLRSLLHQQLRTRYNRLTVKHESKGKATRPAKIEKPANFQDEMKSLDGLVHY